MSPVAIVPSQAACGEKDQHTNASENRVFKHRCIGIEEPRCNFFRSAFCWFLKKKVMVRSVNSNGVQMELVLGKVEIEIIVGWRW